MNLAHVEAEMGQVIAERLKPYVTGEKEPVIQHYFFVAYRGGVFMGARAGNPARIGELVPVIEIQAQLIESLFYGRFIQRP